MRRLAVGICAIAIAVAGCYGNPQQEVSQGVDCAPVKILLAGDSLMGQSAGAIVDALHAAGYPVEALDISHGGSNAIEWGFFAPNNGFANPRDELAAKVAEFQPDIVLVDWGINVPWWLSGVDWGFAAWATQVSMEQVRAIAGGSLYWTTIPPRNDSEASWAYWTNQWVHQLGVPLVDWRAAVTSEFDTYEQFLTYREDDSVHAVRTEDQIHFTSEGIARVAQWTAAALAPHACG